MNVLLKQSSPKDSKVLFVAVSNVLCTKDNAHITTSVAEDYMVTCNVEYDLGIKFDGTNILCASTYQGQNVWDEYFYARGEGKGNYYTWSPSKKFGISNFYVKNGTIHTTRTYTWNNENYPNSILQPQQCTLSYSSQSNNVTYGPIIFYDPSIVQS